MLIFFSGLLSFISVDDTVILLKFIYKINLYLLKIK